MSEKRPQLLSAAEELSWLLCRGYAEHSALKLVGDRHALTDRQRLAVGRCSSSAEDCLRRSNKEVMVEQLAGGTVAVDGFNCLITL